MTNEEAKFLLSGYRPNGADAGDAALAEALAQARRDPALGAWWQRPAMWGVAAALAVMAAVAMGWRVQDERAGAEAAWAWAVWEQAVRADLAAGFVTTAHGAEMG